jgi:predicted enzyme related to lactoylglutathione lyase
MREPFEVAGVGRIAILADSSGAGIGLITPVSQ